MVAPDISVVILCYRAEDVVPVFVAQMKAAREKQEIHYELVLVANYHPHAQPPDRTPEIATDLARRDPTVTVIAKPKERRNDGLGHAEWTRGRSRPHHRRHRRRRPDAPRKT